MLRKLSKYCGFIGIAVLWSSVLISIIITRFNVLGVLPISYLGVYDQSKHLFNSGLIISAVALLGFLYYFSTCYKLSKRFVLLFIVGQICQITVALTPYDSQSYVRIVHVVSAFALAFTLPLSMYALRYSTEVKNSLQLITGKFLKLEFLLFVLGIGWFVLASAAGALSEIVTAVGYDVWIIVVAFKLIQEQSPESASSARYVQNAQTNES